MDTAFAHCYSLHGLNLTVQCEEKALADESEQLFSFLPFENSEKFNSPFHLDLKFMLSEKTAHIPCGSLKPYIVNDISIFDTNSSVIITDGDSTFNIEPWSVRGAFSIHPSFTKKTLASKYNFFLLGVTYLFSYQGLFDLHGAALANHEIGYLFLGGSKSGKSTMALNLVHQGWNYASDDSLLVRSNGKSVEVLSFRKIFYVDPAAASKYPELDTLVSKKNNAAGSKHFLDLEKVYPNQFQSSIVPKVLIFSKITPDRKSALQSMTKGQALANLLKQSVSIFFNRQVVNEHLDVLKRLVQQTDCYQLLAGRDLYDEPGEILKLLPYNHLKEGRYAGNRS